MCLLLIGTEELGTLHLHEEELPVLAGHFLIGKEYLATRLLDNLSGREGRGCKVVYVHWASSTEQGGSNPANSKMGFSGFGHV